MDSRSDEQGEQKPSRIEEVCSEAQKIGEKAMDAVGITARRVCSLNNAKRRLPILEWLPKYSSDDLIGDIIAGLTVGLTTIPQGIAYALIAGLSPNYGLYSAFMGCFVYVFFGSCKDITIGPTAIMSILTYQYVGGNPDVAIMLAFTSGIIIFFCGLLNLGFLLAFVSKPVIIGFTSAAAVTIASSQLKALFGIHYKTHNLIGYWSGFFQHVGETKWQDITLGSISIVVLLFLKKIREFQRFKPNPNDPFREKALKMTIFLLSVGRNAVVVIIATVFAAVYRDNQPFTITGEIKPGLPEVRLPSFTTNNGTTTFVEMISSVGDGIVVIPLIAVLENIAIGSAFSRGKTLDATQEMYALGLCNIVGAFFQAMPTTGSFSRTAVNATSGVRTTAGGIVTGILIILALAVLTPYFQYIPLSALGAVIICAVIFMVEYEVIVPIWRVRKVDELVLWISFLVCAFWKLEYGIIVGVVVHLLILLYTMASPKIHITSVIEEYNVPFHVIVEARTGLIFVNVEKLRNKVTKVAFDIANGIHPVIIDCHHFEVIDFSGTKGMQALCKEFEKRSQELIFTNVTPGIKRGLKALIPNIHIVEREDLLDTIKRTRAEMSITVIKEKEQIINGELNRDQLQNGDDSSTSAHLLHQDMKRKSLP